MVLIHLPSLTCSVWVIVWHEIWDWCCVYGQMLPIGQLSPTCFVFEICHHRSLHCVYPCVAHSVQLWLHGVRLKGVGMGPWNWFAFEWCQFGVEVLPWLKLHLKNIFE